VLIRLQERPTEKLALGVGLAKFQDKCRGPHRLFGRCATGVEAQVSSDLRAVGCVTVQRTKSRY